MIPLHFAKTPFFYFFCLPRSPKQQFSDTLAMVTNLSNPDDTYLKTDLCKKCLARVALAIFASFRFISQTFCMQMVLKASKMVLKTTETSLFCSQIVQFRANSYRNPTENSPIPTTILPRKHHLRTTKTPSAYHENTICVPRKHHEIAQVLKTTRIAYRNTQKDTRYDTSLNVETDSRH